MEGSSDIGARLVAARHAAGVSQRELGERTGVAQPQIARWERTAYRTASLGRVQAVARCLGVELVLAGESLAAEAPASYAPALPGSTAPAREALARTGASAAGIAAFCRSHGIEELALFGSVLTPDFSPTSDVDVLVTYAPGRTPSLLTSADQEAELSAIMRRRVDLVSRAGIAASGNARRAASILDSAMVLYARP